MATHEVADTEPQEEVVNLFDAGFDDKVLLDSQDEPDDEAGDVQEAAGVEPQLPEKYKGKSLAEIVEMHQNLERAYGRHNNELGELRQLTDQILKQQLGNTSSDTSDTIDSDDLLNDPAAVINRSLENNPRLKAIEEKLVAAERAEQLAAFKQKHPTADKVVNDPRFTEWLKASDTRVRLFQQADKMYDYDLASELMTQFETSVAGVSKFKEAKNAMKNASPNAGGGDKGGSKKPYFKRSDLARLRAEDPDRYEKLQPQILAAYAEGRVR